MLIIYTCRFVGHCHGINEAVDHLVLHKLNQFDLIAKTQVFQINNML